MACRDPTTVLDYTLPVLVLVLLVVPCCTVKGTPVLDSAVLYCTVQHYGTVHCCTVHLEMEGL